MFKKYSVIAFVLCNFYSAHSYACDDSGSALSSDQTKKATEVMKNLIHPDDKNTIAYVKECYTLPAKECQMSVNLNLHSSGSDTTQHMTWRIGKVTGGSSSSKVRTLHIYKYSSNYGFEAFDTGKQNKDTPCDL